jgi:hypothetical protein
MPKQEPKPLTDDRIRQGPVARWENEGGATSTGHKPSTIKALCTYAIAITKKLMGIGKPKKPSPEASGTKQL